MKGNEWEAGNLSYHLKERPKWIYGYKGNFLCGNFGNVRLDVGPDHYFAKLGIYDSLTTL